MPLVGLNTSDLRCVGGGLSSCTEAASMFSRISDFCAKSSFFDYVRWLEEKRRKDDLVLCELVNYGCIDYCLKYDLVYCEVFVRISIIDLSAA